MLLLLSSCEPGGREREWMEEKKNHALGHLLFITKCKSLSFRRDLAEDYAISLLCTCITYMYICECRYICRYFWVEIEQYQHTNTFFFVQSSPLPIDCLLSAFYRYLFSLSLSFCHPNLRRTRNVHACRKDFCPCYYSFFFLNSEGRHA